MFFANSIFKDSKGLAPIVGTILMVGLVIILAAVIGSQALSIDTPDDHYERFKEITEQNINNANLPDGLVARWSFDGNYKDVTGNGNDGSAVGSVSFTNGVSGQAIQLDGDGYVEVPSSESLNITNEITLVAYVKWTIDPKNGAKNANIICKGKKNAGFDAEPYRLQHGFYDNNNFEFALNTNNGRTFIPNPSLSPKVTENTWYYLAGTYNGSEMVLYVNGNIESKKSHTGLIDKHDSPLWIGSAGDIRKFNGIIDEVQIYNRALSEAEIKSIGN